MAKPQKENGYTPIANEILEQVSKIPLNGTQLRILCVVFRYTYGFNRKEHSFSVNFILNAMGCKKSQYKQISRELRKMVDKKILIEVREPGRNKSRILRFNKDYEVWTNQSRGLISPEDESVQREGTNQSTQPMDYLVHQERQYMKDNIYSVFEFWNEQKIIVHRKLTDKIKRKISGTLKDYKLKEVKTAIKHYARILKDKEYYWTYKWTLEEFLQRGLEKFLTDACFENYKNKDFKTSKQEEVVYREVD